MCQFTPSLWFQLKTGPYIVMVLITLWIIDRMANYVLVFLIVKLKRLYIMKKKQVLGLMTGVMLRNYQSSK